MSEQQWGAGNKADAVSFELGHLDDGIDRSFEMADSWKAAEARVVSLTEANALLTKGLEVIKGPADRFDLFMDAYGEAGGGYEGLQAVARAALAAAAVGEGTPE